MPSAFAMIAWVLSGGGNRGPIEVGAMRALFERGIAPQMLVGSSAGALNAAFLATDPTPAGNDRLARIWLATKQSDIFPRPGWLQVVRALTGGNALNDDRAVRSYILKNVPPGVETFGDLKARLYLTTSDLQTGRLFLYGDELKAKLVDACLCSAALPVVWDPQVIDGHQFVDGAIVANVAVSVAVDRGATEIYALDLQNPGPYPLKKGALTIAMHSISIQTYQQILRDMERVRHMTGITLHYINLGDLFSTIPLEDFTHTAEMIEQGYRRACEYLDHPTPNQAPRGPRERGIDEKVAPPGAVRYEPKY